MDGIWVWRVQNSTVHKDEERQNNLEKTTKDYDE